MRRYVISLIVAGALAAATLWGIGVALTRPVPKVIGAPPLDLALRSVTIATPKEQTIAAWFLRGNRGAGAILLLHGVRGNRLDMVERARFLARLGYSVLLVDLPAHGESPASHITFGVGEADGVRAAFTYLGRELPGEKIGVIGVSLGAAALVLSVGEVRPSAVVLESMYPTIEAALGGRLRLRFGAAGESLVPLLLWQLPLQLGISAEQLRPIDHMSAVGAPILLLSGSLDEHPTVAETMQLFAAAVQPKTIWIVNGAAHVDLHAFTKTEYEATVSEFFAKYLRGSSRDAVATERGLGN